MSFRVITLLFSLFCVLNAVADTNTTAQTFSEYIDEKHKKFSKYVVDLFSNVDKSISRWVDPSDINGSGDASDINGTAEDKTKDSIDKFFKDEKFVQETEESYLRIRLGPNFQSKESTDFKYRIRAQIPLSRSKESFQLFINDIDDNYFDDTAYTKEESQNNTYVGVNYFTPLYKDIKSKYSIGIRSLSAYAKARYSKDFTMGKWLIQPNQEFKYSTKYDWSEETDIYIDRVLEENSLFRTKLHRRTQAHVDGFDYAVALSYYLTLSKKKGFSFTQQFWGNSKYVCDAAPEPYNGISNYSSFISWRQNIFRKWISYEIGPGISFHRQYDYEPNYVFSIYFDFYFGNI